MRMVVDSNFLQAIDLRTYLSKSKNNFVILTDHAAMEAYKENTLVSIYKSMEIISEHPRQVIILKGTQTVCGLSGRASGLQRRLIDIRQTHEFIKFCRDLKSARNGDKSLEKQLLALGHSATTHMNRVLLDAKSIATAFDGIAATYTPTELHSIRSGTTLTEAMIKKHVEHILWLSALLFADHPKTQKLPNFDELLNTFIFRSSLCALLLALRWISVGGAQKVKPEKLRNDIIDINFAAYATYFDGLLSADMKLKEIYLDAVLFLRHVFGQKITSLSG